MSVKIKKTTKTKKEEDIIRTQLQSLPIAVVGVSALFPGSEDVRGYWRDIIEERDLITDIPPCHWLIEDHYDPDPLAPDKSYSKRGAFLSPIDFDPMEFGVPPSNIATTDTSQLLALIAAKQVLEDAAQGQFSEMTRDRISVILGVAAGLELLGEMACRLGRPGWVKALREEGIPEDQVELICDRIAGNYTPWKESTFPGLLGNVVAGRIANRFDLGGTNCTVDAACASSFSAMAMALNELYIGQSDLVITGGVDTTNDPFLFTCFSKTPALSRTDDCRPFSDNADGMIIGEGLGMVALKRLDDAERDGDRIYALITGIGTSSDGKATSVYSPLPEGQAVALRRCYSAAGYSPATVELVEAHGTATIAGDIAEFKALNMVFDESNRKDRQWCALGSVKSQIGHTKSAAAAAGLIKVIMALHHKTLPPTIKVDKPDPRMDIADSPFYLNTQTRPWIRDDSFKRRASVSSFGFGGTNFHVALEEYSGSGNKAFRLRAMPCELVLLHEKDESGLVALCGETIKGLDIDGFLPYLARSSQENFNLKSKARLAIVAGDENDLKKKITQAVETISKKPGQAFSFPNGIYYSIDKAKTGSVAFLFPGQGSQYLGMGADLAINFDEARAIWDFVAAIPMDNNTCLHDVVFPIPVFSIDEQQEQARKLTATEWAQPAISAASLAILAILKSTGIKPGCVGGHSLGEVTAMFEAGALDFSSLIKVARKRGELMAEAASTPGSMTAVVHSIDDVQSILKDLKSEVIVANHNSPKQVVLSGPTPAIKEVEERLAKEGIKSHRLEVSTAFHSSMMSSSCEPFMEFLKDISFNSPILPLYSNAEVSSYPNGIDEIRSLLTKQINHPVRFVEQIEAMYESGVRTFIEVGPGSVLTKLVNQCLENRPHLAVNTDRKGAHGITSLWKALGQLAVNGVEMDLSCLWKDYSRLDDPRKKEKPKLTIPIMGCNYNKPYPPPGGAEALPKPNPPRSEINHAASSSMEAAPAGGEKTGNTIKKDTFNQTTTGRKSEPVMKFSNTQFTESIKENNIINSHDSLETRDQKRSENIIASSIPRQNITQSPGGAIGDYNAWIMAFQEVQRQTVETQAAYQKAMTESHMTFLKAVESSNMTLSSMINGQRPVNRGVETGKRLPSIPNQSVQSERIIQQVIDKPSMPDPIAPPVIKDSPIKQPVAVPDNIDFKELLLDVVSDKTGYPKDILNVDMGLESDLGIDSIKRVEILSAIKDHSPWLPEVDPGEMANIKTLGDVLSFIEKFASSMPGSAITSEANAASTAIPDNIDFKELLLDVVSDKTGYPKDILNVDMGLESDLGIDSIKRVEILSAIKDHSPWLPEVDPGEMANIKTLGDVLSFIEKFASSMPGSAITSEANAASTAIPDNIDFKELLLDVVSDKTGYPKDILNVDMGLESDLGIDSIKRVEILSAIKDHSPWLPEVDPGEMANIKTLGDVLSFIEKFASDLKKSEATQEIKSDKTEEAPIEASSAGMMTDDNKPVEIGRYALREAEAPHSGFSMDGFFKGCSVAVSNDGNGVANALADMLNDRGMKAQVADNIPENTDALIFLGGLREFPDEASAIAVNKEAFLAAGIIAEGFSKNGGVFITVQDTGGDFGITGRAGNRVWSGGLPGLIKTAAMEWPDASVKAIDLERGSRPPDELAEALINEIFSGGPEIEVGLHADGRRTRLESYPALINKGDSPLNNQSVIAASGGARGVTATTLIEIAREFQPRIVLFGRTPLLDEPPIYSEARNDGELKRILLKEAKADGRAITPVELGAKARQILACREIQANLKAMEDSGSDVRYYSLDVLDISALKEALESIRQEWGPITGIIHGAGVLNDKLIVEKTLEQFNPVFNTKVEGLRSLLSATAEDPIEFICLFSSVAARFGNRGQCDYAMANEILNKMANAEANRRNGHCIVKSINWGPWDGGMVSQFLKVHFEEMGIPLIPLDVGARRLVDEIREVDPENVEIVIGPAPPQPALFNNNSNNGLNFRLSLSRIDYPFIDSHRVENMPVVPVVMALEWFSRAAHLCCPDMIFEVCRELKVLRGIRLEDFQNGSNHFMLNLRQASNGNGSVLNMELNGANGPPHYTAIVEMVNSDHGNGRASAINHDIELEPWSWDSSRIYDDWLFHGPDFQVIRSLEGVSDKAAAAILAGTNEMGWPGNFWKTDAAAMDGGLQLALLWGSHLLGRKSLPTKIGAYFNYHDGPVKGPIRCELKGKVIGKERTISDISFFNEEEKLVAAMRGVEMHMLPGEGLKK